MQRITGVVVGDCVMDWIGAVNMDNRIPALDFVRSCAVGLVIMRHSFDRLLREVNIPMFIQYIMSLGWVGVHLFFTLSGFLIGGMIYKQIKKGNFSFKKFYLKRALRILPLAFGFLIIVYWAKLAFDKRTLLNFLFVTNYFGSEFADHYWSLNVEEHFYLIFPVLFFLLCKITSKAKHIIIILIAVVVFTWIFRLYTVVFFPFRHSLADWVYTVSHWQIDYFLLGVLGSIFRIEGLMKKTKWFSFWIIPLFYFILSIITISLYSQTPLGNQSHIIIACLAPFYALFSFVFLLGASVQPIKIMSFKIFKWISILSYSMYVWHLFIVEKISDFKITIPVGEEAIYSIAICIMVFIITMLFAIPSYWIIEKPFLMIRKKILG